MKKAVSVLGLLCLLTGCTPSQIQQWLAWRDKDPVAAEQFVKSDLFVVPATDCPQWYWTAIDAGFTREEWINPVSWIMRRESGCNPMADNSSSTARGLMQELEFWSRVCGGTYSDLYDPAFNLRCAVHIHAVSGWGAWSTYG